jgi:hypothetical protein
VQPTVADALLAAIPLSFLLAGLLGLAASVPLLAAMAGGSLPAGGALGYALFVDPPA